MTTAKTTYKISTFLDAPDAWRCSVSVHDKTVQFFVGHNSVTQEKFAGETAEEAQAKAQAWCDWDAEARAAVPAEYTYTPEVADPA